MIYNKLKGNFVKEYKGVVIYITTEGLFFCDCINNSEFLNNKTFSSEKLQSIEKAIDNFEGNKQTKIYYRLTQYPLTINTFISKSQVGNRIIFTDGTDSTCFNRLGIVESSLLDNNADFIKLKELVKIEKQLNKQIFELNDKIRKNREEGTNLIKKLKC